MKYYIVYEYYYEIGEWLKRINITGDSQVVAATINRSLSRKREQESEPARLIHIRLLMEVIKMKKELKPLFNLTKARKDMNLTQEELSKLADISRSLLANIERGAAIPSLPVAYKLSKTLKKPIEHLFFNQNVQKLNLKTTA